MPASEDGAQSGRRVMADGSKGTNIRKTATPPSRRRRTRRKLDIGSGVQTSYFFMLNSLLHSRMHTGLESNAEYYDEDVNVYIAHLLNAHIDPQNSSRVAPLVAHNDAELHRMLDSRSDDRDRYNIYRANADALLLALGVFDSLDDRHEKLNPAFRTPKSVYVARASSYYALAASYAAKLHRGPNGISSVLEKLSRGIENYVKILSYMRGQYLGFIRRYSPGELFHLDMVIKEVERDETIRTKRDEFLDTYNDWLKTRDSALRGKLVQQASELREIDPSFEFTPPPQ